MTYIAIAALVASLAACGQINETNSDEALAGAVMGGIAGGVVGNDQNRERNIAIGAAAGAAAGTVLGNNNICTYRNTATGEVFQAECGSY